MSCCRRMRQLPLNDEQSDCVVTAMWVDSDGWADQGFAEWLKQNLSCMIERDREALALVYVEGETREEIGT